MTANPLLARHDWTLDEIRAIHDQPLFELIHQAQSVHRQTFGEHKVQLCSLLSIKTGGCSEDCAYCPQSVKHNTGLDAEKLMQVDEVLGKARQAREAGATRFCMGAAWREVKDNEHFERILGMIRGVRDLGMEACATLGMLTEEQAQKLAEAGLSAYNHNLDTSDAYYSRIITTRTFEDRLRTLENVRKAGMSLCCGGIIGMGEPIEARCRMLQILATQEKHPESVPINALVAVEGTPLANQPPVETVEMVRMIATARILMPYSMVRLSAGRSQMNEEAQLLCMLAGANSLFFGDKLLTTGNPEYEADMALLAKADLKPLEPEGFERAS